MVGQGGEYVAAGHQVHEPRAEIHCGGFVGVVHRKALEVRHGCLLPFISLFGPLFVPDTVVRGEFEWDHSLGHGWVVRFRREEAFVGVVGIIFQSGQTLGLVEHPAVDRLVVGVVAEDELDR